jgi:hypothetical protein
MSAETKQYVLSVFPQLTQNLDVEEKSEPKR